MWAIQSINSPVQDSSSMINSTKKIILRMLVKFQSSRLESYKTWCHGEWVGTCVREAEKWNLIVCNIIIMVGAQRREFGDIGLGGSGQCPYTCNVWAWSWLMMTSCSGEKGWERERGSVLGGAIACAKVQSWQSRESDEWKEKWST